MVARRAVAWCTCCGRRLSPAEQLLVKVLDERALCTCAARTRRAKSPRRSRPSTRLMPWETKLLREEGYLPQRQRARSASRSKWKGNNNELKGEDIRKDDAFRVALADALALARQPRHIMALSRVYAQALEDGRVTKESAQALRPREPKVKEESEDAASLLIDELRHDQARAALERSVCSRESEYRAVLEEATAEGSAIPRASTSRRLVRAIRRLERATDSLREYDDVLQQTAT